MSEKKRAALYVRVSTSDKQSVESQLQKLRKVAKLREWTVVEVYKDEGISGAKGRDKRPGLDAMLNDASKRRFDMLMAWAVDRLGRNLRDLLGTIEHLKACKVGLYLDQQHLDTTTPAGEAMLQMVGVFAQFERATIQQRINAGLSVVKEKLACDGKFDTRGGKVRTRLGRPGAKPDRIEAARRELAKGTGIGKTARLVGLGTGTVHELKRELDAARASHTILLSLNGRCLPLPASGSQQYRQTRDICAVAAGDHRPFIIRCNRFSYKCPRTRQASQL
jgi:DNA invertase Pin-like site-specific DNA recombinase